MLWRVVVWAATAVISLLTLVLLLPSLFKVVYGIMKLFAVAVRAYWRAWRELQRARRRYGN